MERKFFSRKRYVIVFLLILAVLAMVYAILMVKSRLKALQDPQFVSTILSRALECTVNVEKVSISLSGRLSLKNVVIYSPDALERHHEMLTAPLIIASFSPWKIIMGKSDMSLTSVDLGDTKLCIAPDTLPWFQKQLYKWKDGLPPLSIKSGTLELSGFPLVSLRQFKKIRGSLKIRGPQWECELNGTSSDLQEEWELQGKGLLSGKPHIKLRGRNVEIPDFTDEKALKGLPRFTGKVDFQAELQGAEGWKGNAEAGKLISSIFPADKKGSLADVLKGEWKKMNIAFSQKGDAPLELNGEALHDLMGKILFKGKMGKGSWEMTFSSQQISFATLTLMEPELRLRKNGESLTGSISSKTGKVEELLLMTPHFTFQEHDGLTFAGNCSIFDSKATIHGKSSGESMQYTVNIPSFNLKNLSTFKVRQDNLSGVGNLKITITQGNEKRLRFSLQSENLYWAKKKLPRIILDAEQKKSILLISALRVFTGTTPILLAGTINLDKQTCALNGNIEGASLRTLVDLAGGKAPDLQGNLSGRLAIQGDLKKSEFHFDGRILQLVYKGENMGDGTLKATIPQGNEKSLRFSFQSENLYWVKRKLPRISLEAEQKKSILLISALRVFTGTTPILLAGTINLDKQTCALNGNIEEASLPALIDLAGGKTTDLQGNLSGRLTIQGDLKKPEFHFDGRLLQLVYKGKNRGDGTLKVGGTPQAINGRLDLDRPPGFKEGIAQANVEMSYYFLIEGTAKDPIIKPQTTGPKLNVNLGGISHFFQKLTH